MVEESGSPREPDAAPHPDEDAAAAARSGQDAAAAARSDDAAAAAARSDDAAAESARSDQDEAAAARRARYGRLPRRVRPDQMIEMVDATGPHEHREPAEPRREWAP